jgi:hypothetical protein
MRVSDGRRQRRRRVPWYATTPRDSRVPPWYVWCAAISFLSFAVRTVVVGDDPLLPLLSCMLLVLSLVAWNGPPRSDGR